jgi:hypoxanthine phosphoribosyltransferase
MYKHRVFITEDQIRKRLVELADELDRDYAGRTLDIVCILKGAAIFVSDLIRLLKIPVILHFVKVSSYKDGTESSGTVHLHFSSVSDLTDRHVLVVEDIVDTGITIDYLTKHLTPTNPATVKYCVLLNKPERRKLNIRPDYVGFDIPDQFVIGYGLDYKVLGRNLRYIAVLEE